MSRWEVPSSWKWTPIGDIADVVGGGTPSADDESNFDEHGIPWITPADLSGYSGEYVQRGRRSLSQKGLQGSNARLLPPGTVLFTSRAPIGYCVIAANELATNQGFKNFILYGGISPRFVRLYLLAAKDYAESLASGTTFKELSGSRAASLTIPIAPLAEQERVVARVLELQTRTAKAVSALQSLDPLIENFRRSALAKAFRGELTAQWRNDNISVKSGSALVQDLQREARPAEAEPESDTQHNLDIEGLPSIPDTWQWAAAEDVVQPEAEIVYGILQPGEHVRDGIPYVRAKDIQDGVILLDQLLRTRPAIAQSYERSSLKAGDVLLGIIRATKVAIVPKALEGGNITQGTARLRPSKIIRTEYLARWLASPHAQQWLHRRYRGIDMPGLNLRDVRRLPVPVAPIEEQEAIERKLAELAKPVAGVADTARETHERCEILNKAILAKAFRGRLSIQRSGEDSGSNVIGRAQAERIAATQARKELAKTRGKKNMPRRSSTAGVVEDIRTWVQSVNGRRFTFEELRATVPHPYEDIKQAIFTLLRDGVLIRQVFNEAERRMELEGRGG